MLDYKGYMGIVEFDDEADIFHGEVINTRDMITFQGKTVEEIRNSFKDSIDDYLEFCAQRNEQPEKPFSGKFNLRLTPNLHQKLATYAKKNGVSLNECVISAIENYFSIITTNMPMIYAEKKKIQKSSLDVAKKRVVRNSVRNKISSSAPIAKKSRAQHQKKKVASK